MPELKNDTTTEASNASSAADLKYGAVPRATSTGNYQPAPIVTDRTPPTLSAEQAAERIKQIESTVDGIYKAGKIDIPKTKRLDGMGGTISAPEGQTLRELVRDLKPTRTIEVGAGTGLSAVYICMGLLDNGGGFHSVIDPYQDKDWDCCALALMELCGVSDMTDWIMERSDQALPLMVREGEKIDFVFIDGSHRFEHAFIDFYFTDQLLPVGGVVAFDDADWPTVRRVVNFATRHLGYEWVTGSKVDLGPLTRPWGWKFRSNRRKRFMKYGWPAREANHPAPYETIALRKTSEGNTNDWHFWASLED
jgi:predicted O-methyltransferase YrrM